MQSAKNKQTKKITHSNEKQYQTKKITHSNEKQYHTWRQGHLQKIEIYLKVQFLSFLKIVIEGEKLSFI